ncbi:hypothetical protein B0H11DRAFT_2040947 [Mycena galericulata]|nr:hypothetical protein B0H11DRAFT_2040947 [Mycena galericulata]
MVLAMPPRNEFFAGGPLFPLPFNAVICFLRIYAIGLRRAWASPYCLLRSRLIQVDGHSSLEVCFLQSTVVST